MATSSLINPRMRRNMLLHNRCRASGIGGMSLSLSNLHHKSSSGNLVCAKKKIRRRCSQISEPTELIMIKCKFNGHTEMVC